MKKLQADHTTVPSRGHVRVPKSEGSPALYARPGDAGKRISGNLIPYSPELTGMVLYRGWATPRKNTGGFPGNPSISLPRLDAQSEATAVVEKLCLQGRHVQLGDADLIGGVMRCRFVADGCVAVAADGTVSPCLPLMHSHHYYYHDQCREIRAYWLGNLVEMPLGPLWKAD